MLPYQVAMDYGGFQRQNPVGVGVAGVGAGHQAPPGGLNINPAFTHSWFVPADLCVPYKQNQSPILEPGHVFYPIHIYKFKIIFTSINIIIFENNSSVKTIEISHVITWCFYKKKLTRY